MKHIQTFESFINESKINHPEIEKAVKELAYSMANHTKPDEDGNFTDEQIEKAIKKYSPSLLQASKQGMKDNIISRVQEILNESHNESIVNESSDYVYKEDSGQGKPTWVLKLGPEAWKKVEHLFDKHGRPESEEVKKIEAGGARWDLYASDYTQDGKVMHKIYGASGDYTFGNAPTFYQQKYRGNKKAAKEAFDIFIDKFLK